MVSEVEYIVGWVYISAIMVLIFANVANLVPVAIKAARKHWYKKETVRILKHN